MIAFSILLAGCESTKPAPSENVKPKENALEPKEEIDRTPELLEQMISLARQGMVKDCPYNALTSSMTQVKSAWGEPDKVDQAGLGYYATFLNRKVVLGFNKNGEIFDVRSHGAELQKVTYDKMIKSLGEPQQTTSNSTEKIYNYDAGNGILLKIIIPSSGGTIDHISVFNGARSVVKVAASKNDYVLDIRGVSNRMSASAWESMQKWRKEITAFSKTQENVFINGPNKKRVALTFDDGPDTAITPAIIDILAANHVKGSFMFIGSKVLQHPEVARKAYQNGDLVLSHSFDHVELTKLSKEQVRSQIDRAGQAIKSAIGKEPAIIRTPYGDTDAMVASVAKDEGYTIVLWSIDTLDWSQRESDHIVKNAIDNIRNGDIILMHSDSDKTATKKALPVLIQELQKRGFEIVDLETLLGVKAYK